MKKVLFILSFMLFGLCLNAQHLTRKEKNAIWEAEMHRQDSILNDKRTRDIFKSRTPGDELILYRNYTVTGLVCVTGGALVMINTPIPDDGSTSAGYQVGVGLTLLGSVFMIKAVFHVGKAGILLNENGVGVRIPITYKK